MRILLALFLSLSFCDLLGQATQEDLHAFHTELISQIKSTKQFREFYPELNDYLSFVDSQVLSNDQKDQLKKDAVKRHKQYQREFEEGAKAWADYVEELFGKDSKVKLLSEKLVAQKDGSLEVEFILTNEDNSIEERFRYTAIYVQNSLKIIDGFYY